MMKKCSKCRIEKEENDFYRNKSKSDGLYDQCKECCKERYYKLKKLEKCPSHPDRGVVLGKTMCQECLDSRKRKMNNCRTIGKCIRCLHNIPKLGCVTCERCLNKIAKYHARPKIKEHKKQREKKYVKNKKHANVNFHMLSNLRVRLNLALKDQSGHKHTNTMSYVGCTLENFKKHLELQFKEGMSWENYGSVWWIDHCIPCSKFDLIKLEEQKKCFHYTNMKPMLKEDNMFKGARYVEPLILNTIKRGKG